MGKENSTRAIKFGGLEPKQATKTPKKCKQCRTRTQRMCNGSWATSAIQADTDSRICARTQNVCAQCANHKFHLQSCPRYTTSYGCGAGSCNLLLQGRAQGCTNPMQMSNLVHAIKFRSMVLDWAALATMQSQLHFLFTTGRLIHVSFHNCIML